MVFLENRVAVSVEAYNKGSYYLGGFYRKLVLEKETGYDFFSREK